MMVRRVKRIAKLLKPQGFSSGQGATDSLPKPGDFPLGSPESRALYVASLIVGTERSRGYCLELVCADFLAGRTEESTPEEILLVIHRLVHLLPPDYQARLANHSEEAASEAARKC